MVPHSERPRFPGPLLIRSRCTDTSLNVNLWMKSQHEGELTPQCIIRKSPQVPNTTLQVACHHVKNSRGKHSSITQRRTRPESPVPSLQDTVMEVRNEEESCGPAATWYEALFIPAVMHEESQSALCNAKGDLTSQRRYEPSSW